VGVRVGLQRGQQGRCHPVCCSIRHQQDICHDIMASRVDPLSINLGDQCLSSGLIIGEQNINNNIDRINNSLGPFNRTNRDSRLVGRQLLLGVQGELDKKRSVGHVGRHTTSVTAQWRGLKDLYHPNPLSWEIWARPIGFMPR